MHMHAPSHAVLAACQWEMWSQWRWGHVGASSGVLTLYCVSRVMVSLRKEKPPCSFPWQEPRGKAVLWDAQVKGGVGWHFELGSCNCLVTHHVLLCVPPKPLGSRGLAVVMIYIHGIRLLRGCPKRHSQNGHKTCTPGNLGAVRATPLSPAEMSPFGLSCLPTVPHAFPLRPAPDSSAL